jgi:hypothetical protein
VDHGRRDEQLNAHGELVVALIIDTSDGGPLSMVGIDETEAKRLARQTR